MSPPRRVVPQATYQITRRCLDRRFYLAPCDAVNQIVLYALAHAAQKHRMLVHWLMVMANHPHNGITDQHGVLSDFLRDYHADVACALKELRDIPETVWSDAPTSAVELINEAAQVAGAVYALANPVAAGLVFHAAEWPGAATLPGCREIIVKRPDVYFSKDRPLEIRLKLVPPPAWTGTEDQWHQQVSEMLTAREDELAVERRREGRAVLGRGRVLQMDAFDRPRTADSNKPKRNPVLSAGGDGEALERAIIQLRAFRSSYRVQRERWVFDKTVSFPAGTWWVVQRAGASIAA